MKRGAGGTHHPKEEREHFLPSLPREQYQKKRTKEKEMGGQDRFPKEKISGSDKKGKFYLPMGGERGGPSLSLMEKEKERKGNFP